MSTPAREVFGPRMRLAAWLICGISAIGTVVTILVGTRYTPPAAQERDSYTAGPLGHRAFVEILEELGVAVFQDRSGSYADLRAPLMIIEPNGNEVEVDGEVVTLAAILADRAEHDRDTIVVLPKWTLAGGTANPDEDTQWILDEVLPGSSLNYLGAQGARMEPRRAVGRLGEYEVTLPWPQRVDAATHETLLALDGSALIVRRQDGVIVITDPDLLHSWNVQRSENAAVLHRLITGHLESESVVIDEVFHDHGLKLSLPMALGEWPTMLLTAQVLLSILLLVMVGARRFGPPKVASPLGHGPAESIAVSAFVLAEGRPLGTLTASYVREILNDLSQHLGLAPGRSEDAQAAHIDAVARRRGLPPEAMSLLTAARAVGNDKRRAKRDAMNIARAASRLRQRLLS